MLEDDPRLASSLIALLSGEGATVTHVSTLKAAGEQLQQHSFDLLLFDYQLPDGTSDQLLSATQKSCRRLIMTGAPIRFMEWILEAEIADRILPKNTELGSELKAELAQLGGSQL